MGARTGRRRIHWPALLTILRIVLVVPVVVLTLERTFASSWVAFGAFAVAALTDGLDGYFARKLDLVSSMGQLWDPIADKILVTASMFALAAVGRFPVWAAALIVGRELAVTMLRAVASGRGRGFPASKTGKAKTGAQLVAVLLFIVPYNGGWVPVRWAWLALALALSVASGAQYFTHAGDLLRGRARAR